MLRKIKKQLYNILHPVIGEVWELHRVTNIHADTELQRIYEITPTRLESLIVGYTEKGYQFISMNQVRKIISGEEKLAKKFVAITLDDGYRDNFEVAYPIFKKFNIPFCIYLLQNEVSGDVRGIYPMLTQKQIVELSRDPLCTFGCHTYSHPSLGILSKEKQYQEIVRCKEWLEKMLGKDVVDFSYPYGSYNQDTIDIIRGVGILQCPKAWGGDVRRGKHNAFEIPRKLVTENLID